MKLTRRQLASMTPAALTPLAIAAQPSTPSPDAELASARDRLKANASALAAVNVPIETEPAFQFKA